MSQREEFLRAVQEAVDGKPYAVTPTEAGFDVTIDVVDAQWYGLINKAGLTKTFVHHVRVGEDGSYSITDDARELEWVAGVPRISATASRTVGRVKEISFRKTYALDENLQPAKVVDYSFNSEEGRSLVTSAADRLGLKQERGSSEKIGLWVGLGTIAALVVCGIVLGVLALTGAF